MTATIFVPLLAMATLGSLVLWGIVSRRRVEARRADPHAPKSTLAADAPSTTPTGRAPD